MDKKLETSFDLIAATLDVTTKKTSYPRLERRVVSFRSPLLSPLSAELLFSAIVYILIRLLNQLIEMGIGDSIVDQMWNEVV